MPNASPPRVQFVISAKFLTLLIFAGLLLGSGYSWYRRQVQSQQQLAEVQNRFKAPPYFVNGGSSVVRACQHCLDLGKLKPQSEWKVGPPKEIPDTERRWFLAVEDPPVPATVFGVLMMPVFPALRDNPALGFDQSRVLLVLYHRLQRMASIEETPPSPTALPAPAVKPGMVPTPTVDQVEASASEKDGTSSNSGDSKVEAASVRLVGDHAWRVVLPNTAEWFDTEIPLIAEQLVRLIMEDAPVNYRGLANWQAQWGEQTASPFQLDREMRVQILETDKFVGPLWRGSLKVRKVLSAEAKVVLLVRTEYLDRPQQQHQFVDSWSAHQNGHVAMRASAEQKISQMSGR